MAGVHCLEATLFPSLCCWRWPLASHSQQVTSIKTFDEQNIDVLVVLFLWLSGAVSMSVGDGIVVVVVVSHFWATSVCVLCSVFCVLLFVMCVGILAFILEFSTSYT